jgi:hypothetical protein
MRLKRRNTQEEAGQQSTAAPMAAGEGPRAGGGAQTAPAGGEGARPVGRERVPAGGEVPAEGARTRRGVRWRTRDASAAAVGAVGSGFVALARLVMTVAALIALLIVLAIVLRDVDANASNSIVKGIHDGANFFAGAFTGLIKFSGHAKRELTVDWGIAAVVYLLVGGLIARFIRGIGHGGLRFERSRRAALR